MKRSALSAELTRTLLAIISFLLLSRELTLLEVGVVSSITAALAIIGPIATLGLPFRVLRDSALSSASINYRSALLTVCVITGPVFAGICFIVVYPYAVNVEAGAVILLVCAECCLLMSFHILTSYALGAAKPRALLLASLLSSAPRLGASSVLLACTLPSVELYAGVLAGLAVPASLLSMLALPNQGRTRILPLRRIFGEKRAGGLSTTSSLLSRCSDDLDKLLLGYMASAAEVAIYSIPYRLTFYAMIPGRAFLSSKMAGWYKSHGRGVKMEVVGVVAAASSSGLILTSIVYFGWPILTSYVIGEKFVSAQPLIMTFGVAVVLRSAHYSLGELLFARMAMLQRNIVQFIAVTIGVLAMIVLIPTAGVFGAAWATVVIEMLTLFGYLVVLNAKK